MEEIRVNEYVRLARNQGINRIKEIDVDGDYILDKFIADKWGDEVCCISRDNLADEIIKHHPNKVELLEVGDLVEYILHTGLEDLHCVNIADINFLENINNKDLEILSITTKEQFNSIKYVIGE